MTLRRGLLCAILLAAAGLRSDADAAGTNPREVFTLTATTSGGAQTQAGRGAADVKNGPNGASARSAGTETSTPVDCEQNRSSAAATAIADGSIPRFDHARVTLSGLVSVQGGHFAQFVACGFGGALHSEDTRATATATARATVGVKFEPDARTGIPYEILLAVTPPGAALDLSVTDSEGEVTASSTTGGSRIAFKSRPGRLVNISASVAVSDSAQGASPLQGKQVDAQVDVLVRRTALLEGVESRPRERLKAQLAGGVNAKPGEYEAVGGLTLDRMAHCTATLIGARTAVTAAHCVYGAIEVSRLRFVEGISVNDPAAKSVGVTAVDYPQDSAVKYNDRTKEHDIALLLLDAPRAKWMKLLPSGDVVVKKSASIDLVGFGYEIVEGELFARGVKRHLTQTILDTKDATFSYGSPGLTSCPGDSGGPAFAKSGNRLYVAGVMSLGFDDCSGRGVATRVDAHRDWLDRSLARLGKH